MSQYVHTTLQQTLILEGNQFSEDYCESNNSQNYQHDHSHKGHSGAVGIVNFTDEHRPQGPGKTPRGREQAHPQTL